MACQIMKKRKLAALLILSMEHEENTRMQRKKKRFWSKEWFLRRNYSNHLHLLKEINENHPEDYKNYFRMDETTFNILLRLIRHKIVKQDTIMRDAIPAEGRLAATLRYLATGNSFEDLKYATRISPKTLRVIIPETCKVIYEVLKEEYLSLPNTKEDWMQVAEDFETLWNFPNGGGAIDGKHVRIVKPQNSGSYYYNYKGYHSVVLMAVVNAKYEFIFVSVGANGRLSDGGIFDDLNFNKMLHNGKLNVPDNDITKKYMNFIFVGDDAFPLTKHILKPYPHRQLTYKQRIFNYRLSRARRIAENVFGILASRFRIFHTEINLMPENIDYVVLAACTLHNFLRIHSKKQYVPKNFVDAENVGEGTISLGDWRKNNFTLDGLATGHYRNPRFEAKTSREKYLNYFNTIGKVPWQDKMVNNGQ